METHIPKIFQYFLTDNIYKSVKMEIILNI